MLGAASSTTTAAAPAHFLGGHNVTNALTAQQPVEFPLHKPGRTSMVILAVLLMLLCVTVPFGLYLLVRMGSMRVRLSASSLEARGITTDVVEFDQVERFGVLRVPLVARGLGAVVARMKLDNMSEGVNLVFLLKSGKTVKFIANQFERHQDLVEQVTRLVRVPREELTMGLMGPKWPERVA